MAYTCSFEGIDKISEMLNELGEKAEGIAAQGLYNGAGIMAKEVAGAAGEVKTEPFRRKSDGQRLPSPEEKEILTQAGALGIAKFDKNGSEVSTSIGYGNAGYATPGWRTKDSPKAIAKIANAINSGTSFMKKQPFVRQAANRAKQQAEAAIVAEIEKKISDIIK